MSAALHDQMQVLLVAHHANPTWGSEPLIGWRWAAHLDPHCQLTLVTHVRNRPAIEACGQRLRGEVIYVDTERLAGPLHHINSRLWRRAGVANRMLLDTLGQIGFDRAAVRIARERIDRGMVDVIHRVSPISPRYPSRLGRLGVPFILGPINGGHRTAPGFPEVARRERTHALALRGLARLFDPRRSTLRQAARVITATSAVAELLPDDVRGRALAFSENAIPLQEFEPCFDRSGDRLRVLFLGRLIPCKGVDFLLRALEGVSGIQLDVVGDGGDRGRLERLASELAIDDRVAFRGAVPVGVVPETLRGCDVLVLPSVRESGGAVVLEAMASGKPAIVVDHGGPAELVPPLCGVRLPTGGAGVLIPALREALLRYRDDEAARRAAGVAARLHVERNHTWQRRAAAMLQVYREVLEESAAERSVAGLAVPEELFGGLSG